MLTWLELVKKPLADLAVSSMDLFYISNGINAIYISLESCYYTSILIIIKHTHYGLIILNKLFGRTLKKVA